ncbi:MULTISPECIES: hypothetical protein [unclassified Streptomyces]|uniref:effector-associated constant component EACC1 n=1 Tax=unclassified Streptomyces TaxID=2593676 RepID=UPI00336A4CA6
MSCSTSLVGLTPTVARGEMEFVSVAAVAGLSGFVSTFVRLLVAWLRSRRPERARMRVNGQEVTLDLSNPNEAAEYLERLRADFRG